jgi:hypothetical protein
MRENHWYEPQSKLWKLYRSKPRGIIPSAARDCSTYQFRNDVHTELEFHNKNKDEFNLPPYAPAFAGLRK